MHQVLVRPLQNAPFCSPRRRLALRAGGPIFVPALWNAKPIQLGSGSTFQHSASNHERVQVPVLSKLMGLTSCSVYS